MVLHRPLELARVTGHVPPSTHVCGKRLELGCLSYDEKMDKSQSFQNTLS
jgi:hypothetical protein